MMPTPETWSFETSRIGRRVLGVPPPDEELDPNDPRRLVAEPILQLRAANLSEDD
jgi:hypothetical protein